MANKSSSEKTPVGAVVVVVVWVPLDRIICLIVCISEFAIAQLATGVVCE